jgi:hypothetical protein
LVQQAEQLLHIAAVLGAPVPAASFSIVPEGVAIGLLVWEDVGTGLHVCGRMDGWMMRQGNAGDTEAVSMKCKENLRGRSVYSMTNTDMVHSP